MSPKKAWRVPLIIAAILIAAILLSPTIAQAQKILKTDSVRAGQIIDNDVFLTGDNTRVEGTVNGDVFVFGKGLLIEGDVNGSVFAISDKVQLDGSISNNLYAISGSYNQKSETEIERSLYFLGLSLVLEKDSIIGRDLNAVTLSAGLRGDIARDTNATVGLFELFRLLKENVNKTITGIPSPDEFAQATTASIARNLNRVPQRALLRIPAPATPPSLTLWGLAALTAFVSFFIVGLVSLWLLPARFQMWVRKLEEKPLPSAGYGAIVLINGYLMPILIVLLLGSAVLALIYISLPSLAWIFFWGVLGLFIALFSLFLIVTTFVTKTIVAYWVGEFILSKLAPQSLRYKALPLLLGLLIYVPLASVPYLGFFVGLVVTLLGLGTIWLTRKQVEGTSDAVSESDKVAKEA